MLIGGRLATDHQSPDEDWHFRKENMEPFGTLTRVAHPEVPVPAPGVAPVQAMMNLDFQGLRLHFSAHFCVSLKAPGSAPTNPVRQYLEVQDT